MQWFKKQQAMIKDADLPGVEERFAQATRIGEVLLENGYVAVGLDHYVKPDDEMAKALAARLPAGGQLHVLPGLSHYSALQWYLGRFSPGDSLR